MRILVLQIAPALRGKPLPRFDPLLGTLLALLRSRGHELTLLGVGRPKLDALKGALARGLPQLIYADIAPVCMEPARRTFEYLTHHEFVPIVAGGGFATATPSACLSLPGVQAAAIGEPDASLVTYLERLRDPTAGQVVPGVWQRDERGLSRPEMPPLVEDLDSLPFPERELFGYGARVRETGEVEVAVGRGCPQQCAYCTNDWAESIYEERGAWVRRRSREHVLREIAALRAAYPETRSVRFLDHAFALDGAWLREFLAVYGRECGLPFRCHLRLNALDAATVRELAAAGCRVADVELISGSDFIRNEMFDMELSEEQIRTGCGLLRAADIRARIIVYVGAPYESEAAAEETFAMLQGLRPEWVDVRPYYPFPATRAAETCRENGWVHVRGEAPFHEEQAGLQMAALPAAQVAAVIGRIRAAFPGALDLPWWRRWGAASRSRLVQLFRRRG